MIQKFHNFLQMQSWLPALLARIALGVVFVQAGWGKFQNLDRTIGFFESLNIPFAAIQAPFVAGCELVFGFFVLIGLLTRLASIPLTIIMVVAILTAKLSEIAVVTDLFSLTDYLYILLFLFLIVHGAGAISVDQFLQKRRTKK